MMSDSQKSSRYLQYLPTIYQGGPGDPRADFLGRFLKAFEKVLAGIDGEGTGPIGIETILDRIADYFDPYRTPAQFLPWLAGWVALTLKEGQEWYGDEDLAERVQTGNQSAPLSIKRQTTNRFLIDQIVRLYQRRGTRAGLIAYLKAYLGEQIDITINEFAEPFCIGVSSTVGVSAIVGEGRPYYFEVNMILPIPSMDLLQQKRRVLIEIINQEKPAHTYYGLTITVPTMQIGVHSKVGSDTLLGGMISG
jgi:phage tail-like protein